jgi:hypothetical protein
VAQHYETSVNVEYVIRGNSAIIKCQVPSFVADFVDIISWHTDSDETFTPDLNGWCWKIRDPWSPTFTILPAISKNPTNFVSCV